MLRGLSLKHFTGFHFGEKHSHMACQSNDKLAVNNMLPISMPYKSKSNQASQKRTILAGNKSTGKSIVNIPSLRYNKRRSADEGIPKSVETKNHHFADRSYSCPSNGTNSNEGPNVTSQLSHFQSPFDPAIASPGAKDLYRYDINISCHKNQQIWVETLLLPILENELGLRCYLHSRDNLPGVTTVKNIAAAVRESRMTILCFSKDYLSSSWQNYEALIAHHVDPSGWNKRILPIMVENCVLPFKFTVYATLKWPECNQGEMVPAYVKLRRRFFICGLLNALGTQSRERALEIYKSYCELKVPVVSSSPDKQPVENGK